MEDKINEFVLKITGGISLNQPLDKALRSNLKKGEFDIYEVAKRDNQDGTYNMIYKAKFVSAVEIEQGVKKITGKDKSGRSFKLRGAIWHLSGDTDTAGMDFETFYSLVMDKIIGNLNIIWELIKKK